MGFISAAHVKYIHQNERPLLFLIRSHLELNRNLSKGNSLDLDWDTLWKLSDSNTAASWLVGEVLAVDTVHLGEVGHVGQEDGDLFNTSAFLSLPSFF